MSTFLSGVNVGRLGRRAAVIAGVAGVAALQVAAAFSSPASAAAPSSVRIEGVTLRVVSPAGQVNRVILSTGVGQYIVQDTIGTLAAQFPCVGITAHAVRCPAAGIVRYQVETNDLNDTVRDLTTLPGSIYTGNGNDIVYDGRGSQLVSLGAGNDVNVAGLGRDVVFGGVGTDTVSYALRVAPIAVRLDGLVNDGQAGESDNIVADVENVNGGSSNDLLVGSAANNVLQGLNGNDSILGLNGNDALYGGAGNDLLSGGNGNDFLDGGFGADQLFGGAGTDTVSYAVRALAVQVSLNNIANDGQALEGDNARSDVENIIGGSANDVLVGSAARNIIQGRNGNDLLYGLGGPDTLIGGNGADFADGGFDGILVADICQTELKVRCP